MWLSLDKPHKHITNVASNGLKGIVEHIKNISPVSGKHKPPKAGVAHKVASAYASAFESVLRIDIRRDMGNGDDDDDDDDEGIAHANKFSAMRKKGKDLSDNRGRGGKLEASVPTLGACDALELRYSGAPSGTGSNPRQPMMASTIAAFPLGFLSL